MVNRVTIGLCALSILVVPMLGLSAQKHSTRPVPVRVGGSDVLDACDDWGTVDGLKADGDGFLAVRNGPGVAYATIDKLHNGQHVVRCEVGLGDDEGDAEGKWIPIVYSPAPGKDCGLSSPIPDREIYRGPCKSGWVHSSWIH